MARNTAADAQEVNARLAEEYPDARCELDFENPLQLTVATLLSAQTTDERVNQVTPELFRRYPTAADYAQARRGDVEEIIRPLGFQRSKAGHLIGMGETLVAQFGGEVPCAVEDLTQLPGVGRKTALVVRGNAFDLPGITVDTHVTRLSHRLGLSDASTPLAIERDLNAQIPEAERTLFSHRVILHGRRVCTARSPRCGECVLADICPSSTNPRTDADE
ncbi:endonuclease III [Corynebacterium sp. CMW7794]|uniref:Endonuclease III n=2 Tax=Corynebacterium TaxID=1716 RepID=A0A540RA75_9CORY|nr:MULTISPECIES: endonuclease III [Corynebacterium]KXI19542.1 endonuclease III [Corynebacterium sp. CMW7794]MBF9011046.1 endonuclease III [Corynebacterium phoceense]OFL77086.1 endonuclease III [Corynebacterium sp. HMSC077B05]OFN43311.1 endonuclease III [Corynebacterium sp. HMSC072G08]OFP19046.1 endonuclease III [Corynebacterium sp. HMSC065A05]